MNYWWVDKLEALEGLVAALKANVVMKQEFIDRLLRDNEDLLKKLQEFEEHR